MTNGGQPMRLATNRFAMLIAAPVTVLMLAILWLDRGNSGWAGELYNRVYLMSTWALLFTTLTLLSRRPWFAAGLSSTIIGGLWLSAYIKYQYLGAQLVLPDLEVAFLSSETLLEMGLTPTLAVIGYLALLGLAFYWEKPWQVAWQYTTSAWLASITTLALLNIPYFYVDLQWTTQAKHTLPTFVQSIWRTQLEEPANPSHANYCCFKADAQAEQFTATPEKKPNIVVILEESTFKPEQIVHFKAKATFFPDAYPLRVYTAGGATWVQEIAFLHGVAPPLYGDGWRSINLFAPGRLDGRIAPQLSAQGYVTKTIYPTAGRFYGGQRFHEQLGMQEFIDCTMIPECAKRKWNRMPDEVFFERALSELKHEAKPTFMFMATMRQHSPHDKQRQFSKQCAASLTPKQCSIMQDYEERLTASVASYKKFLNQLKNLPERTIVVAFGDHIPGDVAAEFVDSDLYKQDRYRTFFNLWDSQAGFVTEKALTGRQFEKIDLAMLDSIVLDYAGFESHYLTDKLVHLQKCSGSFCGFDHNETQQPTALTGTPQIPLLP